MTVLEYNKFYHLYNRGINGCNLFYETDNYKYFLHLFDKHISPVGIAYAWVLMKNHFHFLVKIKTEGEISMYFQNLEGFRNLQGLKHRNRINQQFSNFFNAYTKAINKRFHRSGSLFEHPFKRIEVKSKEQLLFLVYYIHHNPVHHRFCNHFLEYPWSSYISMISPKKTKLNRSEVLKWFNSRANFEKYHTKEQIEKFEELRIEFLNDQ